MNPLLRCLVFFVTLLAQAAAAGEVLPVAQGRYSVMFVQPKGAPPLAPGTWVQFTGTSLRDVRTVLGTEGMVLGTQGTAVFIEVSQRDAATLADQRAMQAVSFLRLRDADPDMVAARRALAEAGNAVSLALNMRRVTVSVQVEKDAVDGWTAGDRLTFPDAREVNRIRFSDERTTSRYYDLSAVFVSAEPAGPSHYDMTVDVDPTDVFALLRANAEDRLTVRGAKSPAPPKVEDTRCYITQRYGDQRRRVEIPCTQ